VQLSRNRGGIGASDPSVVVEGEVEVGVERGLRGGLVERLKKRIW